MANIVFNYVGTQNDDVFGKSQAPISKMIEDRVAAWEKKSVLPYLFNMSKSTHYAEKISSMTDMDDFEPVGENGAHPWNGFKQAYNKTFEHMTWKSRFSVSQEAVEDAVAIDLKKKPKKFGKSFYSTREKFGAGLFGAAIAGTPLTLNGFQFPTTTGDGVSLFSKSHTMADAVGTISNKFSNPFSEDALGAIATEMQNFYGDSGEELDIQPDTILIPNLYALKKAVFRAVKSEMSPDDANNGVNVECGNWRVIVWPYLNRFISAGSNPYIILDSSYNEEFSGAEWFDRSPLTVKSYIDENTDANVWKGRARFTAGFFDFRAFAVGGVAGGTELTL